MASTRALLLVTVLLTSSGCHSYLTGNEGRFTFAYRSSADILDFNKPLAPGGKRDVLARSLGSNDEMEIVAARSSSPAVLKVVDVQPTHVTVQGGAVGNVMLTVKTNDGLHDSVNMHVAKPEHIVLQHACTNDTFAVYPANSRIAIPFGMERGQGQPVTGYGFWPIRVRPSKSLKLDRSSRDDGALYFETGEARHRVSIRSRIDDGILGLALVDNGEVDGVNGPEKLRLMEGEERIVGFSPTVGGVTFCQAQLLTQARSLTPDVCSASAKLSDHAIAENKGGLVRVKAKKYGFCEFEVRFPEADGGDGVSKSLRVPIGKYPKSDRAISSHDRPTWLAPLLALIAPLMLLPLAVRWRRR